MSSASESHEESSRSSRIGLGTATQFHAQQGDIPDCPCPLAGQTMLSVDALNNSVPCDAMTPRFRASMRVSRVFEPGSRALLAPQVLRPLDGQSKDRAKTRSSSFQRNMIMCFSAFKNGVPISWSRIVQEVTQIIRVEKPTTLNSSSPNSSVDSRGPIKAEPVFLAFRISDPL